MFASAYDGDIRSELYNPLTGKFAPKDTTSKYCCFYWHTASLLPNGTVLIAGGGDADEGFFLSSNGIYNPGTGTLAATGNMTTFRMLHTATVLLDGTVLITGGARRDSAGAELYDSLTRTFNYVGDMTRPRIGHTATSLNNGTVLIAGGRPSFQPIASAELYVPRLLVSALVVDDLRFDLSSVAAGDNFAAYVSGSNLTPQTFFDVRFNTPGSNSHQVVLNWQQGLEASHSVPTGTAPGMWMINGIRAHQIETDHTGSFNPVSATITVSP